MDTAILGALMAAARLADNAIPTVVISLTDKGIRTRAEQIIGGVRHAHNHLLTWQQLADAPDLLTKGVMGCIAALTREAVPCASCHQPGCGGECLG